MYEAINARINAGVIIANIIPIIRFVQHNISDINMYNKKPINPHIIVTNTLINFFKSNIFYKVIVRLSGFEPEISEPKSDVLPITPQSDNTAILTNHCI